MFNRRDLLIGSGAALAAGTGLLKTDAAFAAPTIALPEDISATDFVTVNKAPTRQKFVAMTFDDGPHPSLTPALLDILKKRRIRATFYVIGNRVAAYPDIVKRIVDEGHELGNHSWRHPMLSRLSSARVFEEIDRTNEVIYKATRRIPVTMRPPYGALTYKQRQMLHDERSMPTILWSVDPEDWRRPGASVVANRIVGHAHSGAIVLSHDIHRGTVQAMPTALDALIERGYRFATVSMILGRRDWSKLRFKQANLPTQKG